MSEAFDPYAVLGVPRTASADEITAAWRRAAMSAHPDRGGTTEAMVDVNMAYKILSDEALRSQYDAGGGTARPETIESKAEAYLIAMIQQLIRSSPTHHDLIAALRDSVQSQQLQCTQAKARTLSEIALLRERVKRLHGPEGNFIETVILSEIRKGEALLSTYDADQQVMATALALLGAYRYDTAGGGPWPAAGSITMDWDPKRPFQGIFDRRKA